MPLLLLITENARCQCDSVAAIFDFVPGCPYFEALAYRFFCLANDAHFAAFEFPGPWLRYTQVDRSQRSARLVTIRPMNLVGDDLADDACFDLRGVEVLESPRRKRRA